jgi:Ca2+-transporting ATPase
MLNVRIITDKNNKARRLASRSANNGKEQPAEKKAAFMQLAANAHSTPALSLAEAFNVDVQRGLDEETVKEHRAYFGLNALQSIRPRQWWWLLFRQFTNLVVGLLAVAALIAFAKGDFIDGAAILVVLVLNASIGFFTEWKANLALEALRRESQTLTRVRRKGREFTIRAEDIVPGDVIILNPGDKVPADARIIESFSLQAEESALTGESLPVEKSSESINAEAILAERSSMLYVGTTVSSGRAVAIVTATSVNTELGKIGRLVADASTEQTPLERRLGELGRRLVYLVLAIAAIVIVTGWLHGEELWMMAEVGISLAVAAVPEALPAVTTLILALGVLKMARERAIVRRLVAVEALGSATIICSDKTGTLTENRMTVREFRLANGRKYETQKDSLIRPQDDDLLERALRVSVLCNEASFHLQTEEAQTTGDPTETALLLAAHKFGVNVKRERSTYEKLIELPFETAKMRMVTVHSSPDDEVFARLKGAPAVVLNACESFSDYHSLDDETRARFLAANEEMASRALRVLALAEKRIENYEENRIEDLEKGYNFLGFVGMIDPPRQEVAEAISLAHQAGIRTVMLTGDQIQTARAIARELRLGDKEEIIALHASDLEKADHEQLARMAREVDVFARVSPEDKLRIVAALQNAGEIVAVTGDGINDAPALKKANIGVAMGMRGTEVAKEAADLVLADDNFSTIVRAIESGRTIYANIIKFVHLMFSKNLGLVIFIFISLILGLPLPLLPLQILWINFLTDFFPAFALAVEPPAADVMKCKPRSPKKALLSAPFMVLIGWQGLLLSLILFAAYWWALAHYGAGAHSRTIALLTLVGIQLGHLFNCRSRASTAFRGLFRNPFVWIAVLIVTTLQFAAIYFSPLASVLNTVRPFAIDWVVIGLSIIATIFLVELGKLYVRKNR